MTVQCCFLQGEIDFGGSSAKDLEDTFYAEHCRSELSSQDSDRSKDSWLSSTSSSDALLLARVSDDLKVHRKSSRGMKQMSLARTHSMEMSLQPRVPSPKAAWCEPTSEAARTCSIKPHVSLSTSSSHGSLGPGLLP